MTDEERAKLDAIVRAAGELAARAAIAAVFDWLQEPSEAALLQYWLASPCPFGCDVVDNEAARRALTAMLAAMRKEALG